MNTAKAEAHLIDQLHAERPTVLAAGAEAQPKLADEGPFPDLSGAVAWLNSPPLSTKSLRGKVVLIDFWTYSCINCLRALPYVEGWATKYKDAGLVVIGVQLVHHSDRGVQYASYDYTAELQQHSIRISMSRTASPYDNAQAESFIKTLKYEEVYRTEYRNLEEARASIGEFLEKIYNRQRLHSALSYRPPLGRGRSRRQGWPHSDCSHSKLGQSRSRQLDTRCACH